MIDKWLTPEEIAVIRAEDERLRKRLGTAYDCQNVIVRLLDHIDADNEKVKTFVKEMREHWRIQNQMDMYVWRILMRLYRRLRANEDVSHLVKVNEQQSLIDIIERFPRKHWEDEIG